MSHLENVSEDEINRLLGMVVDVENLFMSVHKEEDTDTKQVYFYLFKVTKGLVTPAALWSAKTQLAHDGGQFYCFYFCSLF